MFVRAQASSRLFAINHLALAHSPRRIVPSVDAFMSEDTPVCLMFKALRRCTELETAGLGAYVTAT